MNSMDQQIIRLLSRSGNSPLSFEDIARQCKLRSKSSKKINKSLNRLVSRGRIARARKGKYILAAPAGLVAGTLEVLRNGNGFLLPAQGGKDVFVAARNMGTALPGDKVVVRLLPDRRGKGAESLAGEVAEILERRRHDIVGTLGSTGKFFYVVPLDPAYSKDIYVSDTRQAKTGDRVVVRFTGWQHKHVNPEGNIIDVIGPADDPSLDTIALVRHYGFRTKFPAAAMQEAESAACLVDQPGERKDIREAVVITIDPEKARDFDDALSLEKDPAGNRVLGVHIADVSHFVRKGGALDKEACTRCTSVYLPDMVIPMLPEQLSNGICSLKPGEDRLTLSVFITFDKSGSVLKHEFTKTLIHSNARFNYRQALAILQGKKAKGIKAGDDAVRLLKDLHKLAQQMRQMRFANHALDLDIPECEIVMDRNSRMTGIRLVENDISHQLIEECMIAANEAVGRRMSDSGVSIISRHHDQPQPEKVEDLQAQLKTMGYRPGDLSKPANLSAFLESIRDDPLAHSVRILVLRSMQRAVYSSDQRGHFGLAKAHYTHFTSPIRRYPDLVLHRQLGNLIALKKKNTYKKETLESIAATASKAELEADQAERAIIEIKKYRFLESQLEKGEPEVYDSIVVGVANIGLFVELLDLQVQGLVHISLISGRFVRFDRNKKELAAGKKRYGVGDRLKVFVTDVDFAKRRIDFGIK